MLQADDEDDMMEMQMKSPFGSSFRTFNATDYKPIGKASCPHLTLIDLFFKSFITIKGFCSETLFCVPLVTIYYTL